MKICVTNISPAWACCAYNLIVSVEDCDLSKHSYILDTLRKWFGSAEYFWDNSFLCDLKAGRK